MLFKSICFVMLLSDSQWSLDRQQNFSTGNAPMAHDAPRVRHVV